MTIRREVNESPIPQGVDEQISYTLTTTPWGSAPASLVVKLYSIAVGGALTDVSATLLVGVASAMGDVITTPIVTGLTAGTTYRLEIKFTVSGNVFEAYCIIGGEQ